MAASNAAGGGDGDGETLGLLGGGGETLGDGDAAGGDGETLGLLGGGGETLGLGETGAGLLAASGSTLVANWPR